jgi:predicted MPP superfamily phosphohydrolase
MIETLIAGAFAVGAYAGLVEPRRLRVRTIRVPSAAWPENWQPLRVAVLSDFHASWPHVTTARLRRVVERTIAASPDLILLPGDFVSSRTLGVVDLPIELTAQTLSPLAAAAPTYAVLGNHDHHVGGQRVVGALARAGITSLHNGAEQLRLGDRDLWLAGVDCMRSGRADLQKALANVPKSATTVLMSHIPDIIRNVPDHVMLTVSGHTHGGQIRLPGLGPLITHSSLPRHMARGLHRIGSRHLFVSSGIGATGLPIRLGSIPEIALLTLESAGFGSA